MNGNQGYQQSWNQNALNNQQAHAQFTSNNGQYRQTQPYSGIYSPPVSGGQAPTGGLPQGQSPRPALSNVTSPNSATSYPQNQQSYMQGNYQTRASHDLGANSMPLKPTLNGPPIYNQQPPTQAINRPPMTQPVYNGVQNVPLMTTNSPSTNGTKTPTAAISGNPSPVRQTKFFPPVNAQKQYQHPSNGITSPPVSNSALPPNLYPGQPPQNFQSPPTNQTASQTFPGQPQNFQSPQSFPGPPQIQQQTQPLQGAPPAFSKPSRPVYPSMPPQAPNHVNGAYPTSQGDYGGYQPQQLVAPMSGMSVREGMNRLWGTEPINLLQEREVLNVEPVVNDFAARSCSPDVMRCTMLKIPETSSLLQKSRLPLGIVLQPFRDLEDLPIIQTQTIVRCRVCRTYINPFIQFIDRTRWKCNICFRVNDLPTDFLRDPVTGRYGEPDQRPEVLNGTVEYIAPSEYMVRPPQAATYLFVMDVSFQAVETGYLKVAADMIAECLDDIPGDGRTTVGFITFDSAVHFYSMDGTGGLPRQMVITDVDDVFIPYPESLLCNLKECRTQIEGLLEHLGKTQVGGSGNCLGAALQAAYKLLAPVGGRVSVFQCCLPNLGPGALQSRENPNERSAQEVTNLNPATDFYKKLALDCSGQQIAVDLFLLSSQFADLATISGISKFTSGQINFYPKFHVTQAPDMVDRFRNELQHYLTRNIGFEAVMRIRCTKGLQLHTFHGNFFVRSVDLLSLPNVNPDAGFSMQISIEENLTDCNTAVFQAAVLHTSASGERRIRVHTLCVGVSSLLQDILNGADQEAVVALLAKMAVDRTLSCSINDARDAMINAAADLCHAYANTQRSASGGLMMMRNCKTLPLFVLGLLKQRAFRVGVSTKLDDRIYDMERIKNLPLEKLMLLIYPALYPLHLETDEPPRLQLSFEKVDKVGLYLLETADTLYIYVGGRLSPALLQNVFGVQKFSQLPDNTDSLPEMENQDSIRVRSIVEAVASKHAVPPPLWVLREDSQHRTLFTRYMLNDRGESVLSYCEFLQHLRNQLDSY